MSGPRDRPVGPSGERTTDPGPRRSEGPTPAGGAYAIAYRDEAGEVVEVVEYDADGRPIARTYAEPDEEEPPWPDP